MARFVDEKIIQRKILLFSKKYVPACRQVKEILNSYNLSSNIYEVVEIERRQDVNEIETHFQVICLTDRREVRKHGKSEESPIQNPQQTVPQLFINQKYIGGQKEILLLQRTGELANLLNEVQLEEDMRIRKMAEEAEEMMEISIIQGEEEEEEGKEEEGKEEEKEQEQEEGKEEEKEQQEEEGKEEEKEQEKKEEVKEEKEQQRENEQEEKKEQEKEKEEENKQKEEKEQEKNEQNEEKEQKRTDKKCE